MELQSVRYFLAAAEWLNSRRASDQLDFAQSVFSRQIAAHQDELGIDLFARRSTGVRLTEAGRAFVLDGNRILSDVDRARKSVASVAFGIDGRLRVAVREDVTTLTFAPIIAAHRNAVRVTGWTCSGLSR